jgi:pimeloyl-ACP methyl ester carboxylesterase
MDEARRHARIIPNAKLSLYRGVGHAPFLEAPARFNRDLSGFAAACHSGL